MASGLSKARLARLHEATKASVERGETVGVITLVERRGEAHVDVVGLQDRERNIAMKRDTIFRLMSSSKPITAAAAMILVEEGKLRLDEPVDRLLPEMANRKVLKSIEGPLDDTVPAIRPITLRDCLTFRLGHGMMGFGPATTPFLKALADLQLAFQPAHAPDEWMRRLGSLPLAHQPGERVLYNTGADVVGVLIARASGKSFGAFLKERLFEPLGMKDTGFSVPAEKIERFSSCYGFNPQTRELALNEDAQASRYLKPPAFESGGGGLVSTLDDCLAFGRMMLGNGKHGKTRILSRPTVEAMTTDYLTAEQKRATGFFPSPFELVRTPTWAPNMWEGRGWGLGMMVITERLGPTYSVGRYGLDGAFGTMWWADPKEDMNLILMVQRGGGPGTLASDFFTLAYAAIDD